MVVGWWWVPVGAGWCLYANLVIGFDPNIKFDIWSKAKLINHYLLKFDQVILMIAIVHIGYHLFVCFRQGFRCFQAQLFLA